MCDLCHQPLGERAKVEQQCLRATCAAFMRGCAKCWDRAREQFPRLVTDAVVGGQLEVVHGAECKAVAR